MAQTSLFDVLLARRILDDFVAQTLLFPGSAALVSASWRRRGCRASVSDAAAVWRLTEAPYKVSIHTATHLTHTTRVTAR